MINIRNALAAGAMGASALVVPMTMPAQLAHAGTVAGVTLSTPALTAALKPCRHGKCHSRHPTSPGPGGGLLDDGISDNRVPGGGGGGSGIDN
ncbi:hypothetical protein [Streptomyces anulatus]|uniref:hypothetical protein n=1 Tax=Streptomyces anulatus TaxID=1892 RepID=UPI003441C1A3